MEKSSEKQKAVVRCLAEIKKLGTMPIVISLLYAGTYYFITRSFLCLMCWYVIYRSHKDTDTRIYNFFGFFVLCLGLGLIGDYRFGHFNSDGLWALVILVAFVLFDLVFNRLIKKVKK